LKKAPPERIKELLGIMNWLAAPFGTQEDRLIYSGFPTSTTRSTTGANPKPTDKGHQGATTCHGAISPASVGLVRRGILISQSLQATSSRYAAGGIEDRQWVLTRPTNSSRGLAVDATIHDGLSEIIRVLAANA